MRLFFCQSIFKKTAKLRALSLLLFDMNALSIRNLRKTYSNGFEALKGIDLDVQQGDFFALLGANGAGKSTAIGIISSLVTASSGSVNIFGHNIKSETNLAKSCLGLVPQEINFNQFSKFDLFSSCFKKLFGNFFDLAEFESGKSYKSVDHIRGYRNAYTVYTVYRIRHLSQ